MALYETHLNVSEIKYLLAKKLRLSGEAIASKHSIPNSENMLTVRHPITGNWEQIPGVSPPYSQGEPNPH